MENANARSESVHHFIRAAIIMGFAMYIVYLVKSGDLIYYIAPRMESYVKYAAVALYIVATYKIYIGIKSLWGKKASCDCDHSPSPSIFRNTVAYSLFFIPLMMGFLMPNTALSSEVANKKGMNLSTNIAINKGPQQVSLQNAAKSSPPPVSDSNAGTPPVAPTEHASSGAPNSQPSVTQPITAETGTESTSAAEPHSSNGASVTDEQLKKMFAPPDQYSDDLSQIGMYIYKQDVINVKPEAFMEILSSVDLFKPNFYGKKIEISGFVYRQDDFKPNQIAVGRFAVSCCSADASPYGVLTEFAGANNWAKDAWVKVTGTIEKGHYGDNEIFKVNATKIEKIPAPKSPYVYPNMDALSELTKQSKH